MSFTNTWRFTVNSLLQILNNLKFSDETIDAILENLHEAIFATDKNLKLVFASKLFIEVTGIPEASLINRTPSFLMKNTEEGAKMWMNILKNQNFMGTVKPKAADNTQELTLSLLWVPNQNGKDGNYIGIVKPSTNSIRNTHQVTQSAKQTNREAFTNQLSQRVTALLKQKNSFYQALFYITLEHKLMGRISLPRIEEIMLNATSRLKTYLRGRDIFTRANGNSFYLLVADLKDENDAATVAEKISNDLKLINNNATPYLGITIFPTDAECTSELLEHAHLAHEQAMEDKIGWRLYSKEKHNAAIKRFSIISHMRDDIEHGFKNFTLFAQPKLHLSTGITNGFETLLRWNNPNLPEIGPAEFIPLAEETELIIPLGTWVLEQSCIIAKALHDDDHKKSFAVNVSALQFNAPNFAGLIKGTLDRTKFEARYLELEITESMIMKDIEKAIKTLEKLVALGIRIAVDDFGTGYSQLSSLKKFPVHTLKIDRSLLPETKNDKDSMAIFTMILGLAKQLNLCTTAEGGETDSQVDILIKGNCDQLQGYWHGKPMPIREIRSFLEAEKIQKLH